MAAATSSCSAMPPRIPRRRWPARPSPAAASVSSGSSLEDLRRSSSAWARSPAPPTPVRSASISPPEPKTPRTASGRRPPTSMASSAHGRPWLTPRGSRTLPPTTAPAGQCSPLPRPRRMSPPGPLSRTSPTALRVTPASSRRISASTRCASTRPPIPPSPWPPAGSSRLFPEACCRPPQASGPRWPRASPEAASFPAPATS